MLGVCEIQDQGAGRFYTWWELTSRFKDVHLFTLSLHGGRRQGSSLGLLLYRTNPVQQGSILRTWSSPNIPPPKTIALESGFQCTDFGGTQTSVSGSQSSVSQLEFYHWWITTQKAPFLAWQAALRYLNYSQSPIRTLWVIRWLLYNVSLFLTRK